MQTMTDFLQFRAQQQQENAELMRFMRETNKILSQKTYTPMERALNLAVTVPLAPLKTYTKAEKDQVIIEVERDSVAVQIAEEVLHNE
jgi:hypothetical protein